MPEAIEIAEKYLEIEEKPENGPVEVWYYHDTGRWEEAMAVIVEHRSIAEYRVMVARGLDLGSDLAVKDPPLGLDGGLLVDRKRTPTGDFADDLDIDVAAFESGRKLETERRLSDTVAADERDLHRGPL